MRSFSRLFGLGLPLVLLAAAPVPRDAPPPRAFYDALRAADLRLATIAYRLTTANAALCDRLQPQLGMPIHALTQYEGSARDGALAAFGFESVVAVEAVVPTAPAARAGIVAGDSIVQIGPVAQPELSSMKSERSGPADRDAAEAAIAAIPVGQPVALTVVRSGKRIVVPVKGQPGCRSRFEILLGSGLGASADGSVVQIGERYFEGYDDAEIAVVVAHELAHNIMRHRARLDAAKVDRGMLAELGRNGRLFRQTEEEADRIGIYLLANAGYDPLSAPAFWRNKGGAVDGALFRSRTHASSKARAAILTDLAREIAATPTRPIVPALIGTRDTPLK